MLLTPQIIVPTLLVPLFGWRLYRRFRANFGRQTIQHSRMITRLVILIAVTGLFLVVSMRSTAALEAAVGGLLIGAVLAVFGLRLTRFGADEKGSYYTPNPLIGGALTLLLVGRLVYKFAIMFTTPHVFDAPPPDPFAPMVQSPLTMTFVLATMGYYLVYVLGVLYKSRGGGTTGTSK